MLITPVCTRKEPLAFAHCTKSLSNDSLAPKAQLVALKKALLFD